MTLDEAIKRYTDNAEYERTHGNLQGCLDFRQLAEWLIELKQLRKQLKTGHWKYYQNEKGDWINECSVCGSDAGVGYQYPYCPNCGTRMIEPQDTETWNGMHGQITVPSGTFERIFNDVDSDNDI